ncbi:MAG: MnmC family methyltransferase [Candidatus Omnitrophica bacterium]|nr:MnmC family methyltransferase [Candidatus Omnitrophota bacterium]
MIITKKEIGCILKNKEKQKFLLEVDFGLRKIEVEIKENKAILESNLEISLEEKIKDNFCYNLDKNGLQKIAFFSPQTNCFYKLMPTSDWPTVCINSVPMHKLNSPKKDTENKINFLKPFGVVLDTCMGLGYTAILASKTAQKVITFEKDKNILYLAKINPLSRELFLSPNIKIEIKDIAEEIARLKSQYFDCIIHDPPTFKLAPQLYTISFYEELLRVLKKNGRLFHYTPLYKITHNFDFPSKIEKKLKKTGFRIIEKSQVIGGILCQK